MILTPITWTGNLADDCTASWAGLTLRTTRINDHWQWSVHETQKENAIIDSSDFTPDTYRTGDTARQKAEAIATDYISVVSREITAHYKIEDRFKITGRGLVFVGLITEGNNIFRRYNRIYSQ